MDDERRSSSGARASRGVGQSEIGRRLYRDPLELTLDACLAAIDDAGLTTADIDGLVDLSRADGHAGRVLAARARTT